MNRPLHIDVETRSPLDLRKTGSYTYFAHPQTDLWCAAYAFGDDEPQLWVPGQPCPPEIVDHVIAGGEIFAWNAAFERGCWNAILTPRHGWPLPKLEQFMCTMAEAFAMNLPGKLDDAAPALGLDVVKDQKGHRLMLQMCRPRSVGKDEIIWWDDAERRQRLYDYCKQDVRVEQAVGRRVLRLRPEEKEIFWLDAKINDRGVFIDADLCRVAKRIVAADTERLDALMHQVTKGAVQSCSNVQQLIRFLKDNGIQTDSVAKDIITDLLILDLPEPCRQALEIRQEAAKTSTAKIDSMLTRREADGRMRGNLQYHGSGTGRWAARGAQLQNLPRPVFIKGDTPEEVEAQQKAAIDAIFYGSNVLLDMTYGRPLTVVADCIRGMIKAPAGRELLSADFANIEGRVNAWVAGQEDKLDAFRAYDGKTGPDLYLVAASSVYGVPIKDAKPFRQVGKVCELALGYQGGPGAFANMAKNYGLKIGTLYDTIWDRAPAADRETAVEAWAHRGKKSGMAEKAWIAAELIKIAWRRKNYRISDNWKETESAAYDAFMEPGRVTSVGPIKYRMAGSFLWCRLPSGRALCYPYPRLTEMVVVKDAKGEETEIAYSEARKKGLEIIKKARPKLVYKSVNQWTRKWEEKFFYGGLAVENIVQAVSRDIMAEAMLRVEKAGYDVVLTVHDEIVSEVPANFGSLAEFNELMVQLPTWADGLPVTAEGWRGVRYRKG